jgi:3-hydroxyisobutyrate dehydrogenase-like beta-hydroxyacid dehydrogenase
MRIAVLGLGRMGHAVAERLLSTHHDVVVWNRSPGKAGDLQALGAREVGDPVEALAEVEVGLVSLTDDDAVLSVLLPDGRPLDVPDGTAVVDASTVSPATSRRLAQAYPRFVAAPILGGPTQVLDGKVTMLVGGQAPTRRTLAPLWDSLAQQWRDCGDEASTATTAKLLNNYLLMAGIATLAETIAAAQGAGLDADFTEDLLESSLMVAPGLKNRLHDLIAGKHDGWFATTNGAKDVGLLRDLAGQHGLALPLAEEVEARYRAAIEAGHADEDIASVIELLRS